MTLVQAHPSHSCVCFCVWFQNEGHITKKENVVIVHIRPVWQRDGCVQCCIENTGLWAILVMVFLVLPALTVLPFPPQPPSLYPCTAAWWHRLLDTCFSPCQSSQPTSLDDASPVIQSCELLPHLSSRSLCYTLASSSCPSILVSLTFCVLSSPSHSRRH